MRGTLAYLGSLRNTSRIEFPVVLDNPAAPLDKPGREALAKLLVENAESQTILLTHSGGYELDNLLSDFASSINKAYLLETSSTGDNNRSIARKVKG